MPDPYGLTPEMELVVLRLCAEDSAFWRRVGRHMEPTRFDHPMAKTILGCIRAVERESKRHPSSMLLVVQRARRFSEEGKLTIEKVLQVSEAFDQAVDLGRMDLEGVIAEVAPLVRRHIQAEALNVGLDEHARRGDFTSVKELLERADSVGRKESTGGGLTLSSGALAAFDLVQIDGLRTGILELDVAMGGGMPRKSIGTVMADSGVGKSIFLISQAAEAVRLGLHVVVATLEIDAIQQLARLTANLTGVPTNEIRLNVKQRARAEQILQATDQIRGPCYIGDFDAGVTTPEDMVRLVDEREQKVGRRVDLLVVDYADKMTARTSRSRDSDYELMKLVWEGLRDRCAREHDMWVWTATQPRRRDRKEAKYKLDMGDTGDSIHKVRVSDVFLTLNPLSMDAFEEYEIFVAKNRGDKARYVVGPVFGDFNRARSTATTLP